MVEGSVRADEGRGEREERRDQEGDIEVG